MLLVHGVTENRDSDFWGWGKHETSTLAGALDKQADSVVGYFDYGDLNSFGLSQDNAALQFNNAADRLKKAIDCLNAKSGAKVSLVGYSEGGLLSQAALAGLNSADPREGAADKVSGLVAIATPWIRNWVPALTNFTTLAGELRTIPSSVPVMPVGAQIESKGLTLVPGEPGLEERRQKCPFSFIQISTSRGDGCFESKVALNPDAATVVNPTTLDCVDNRRGALGTPSGNLSAPIVPAGPDPCDGFLHEHLQKNEKLVDPVIKQLNGWRDDALKSVITVDASSAGCNHGTHTAVNPEQSVTVPHASQPLVAPSAAAVPPPPGPSAPRARDSNPGTNSDDNPAPQGERGNSGHSDCPNGMIRIAPETDTNSGCVVPGAGQQQQPQPQIGCPPTQHRNNQGVCESDTLNQAGPCPQGLHRDTEGVCRAEDTQRLGNGSASSAGSCPNGMIRIAPETSNGSGCVVPGAGQQPGSSGGGNAAGGTNGSSTRPEKPACPSGQQLTNQGGCQIARANPNDPQNGPCPAGLQRDKEGVCRSAGAGNGQQQNSQQQGTDNQQRSTNGQNQQQASRSVQPVLPHASTPVSACTPAQKQANGGKCPPPPSK